jgi:SNF2 family DNA or RNA helicase
MPINVEIKFNNRIEIQAPYFEKDRIRSIPGARWNKDSKFWNVPLSWAAAKQLRSTFGSDLVIGGELLKWATAELQNRVSPSLALRDAMTVQDPGGLVAGLYPFQQAGAQFLLTAQHALLADPMGSGKTIQVIAAARARHALPLLVICPNSMKRTWKREVEKWWPGVPVYVVEGSASKRKNLFAAAADEKGAVVILNWEAARLHSRLAPYGSLALTDEEKIPKELNQIPWKAVVADEAHRMKDPRSKQTRAVWSAGHAATVAFRWALTGTPLTNAPDTLYPILHFLDPLEWPSKTQFIERYCLKDFNPFGGLDVFGIRPDAAQEFFEIFDPRMRRMPLEIILPELPPIVSETRYIDMPPKQAAAYKSMAENLWAETEDGNMVIAQNPISQLTRLAQFASATIEQTTEGLRLSEPSNKLDQLMVDLDDYLSQDEPVVVFAQSRQLIEMASKRLEKASIQHTTIKGGQTPDERQNAIDRFQNGEVNVVLAVLQAGGVGITLNRSRIGIWLQRSWSNVDHQQSIGRIRRIGSEVHSNIVTVDYVTNGTIENFQLEVLQGKADNLEEICRDRAAIKRLMKGEPI